MIEQFPGYSNMGRHITICGLLESVEYLPRPFWLLESPLRSQLLLYRSDFMLLDLFPFNVLPLFCHLVLWLLCSKETSFSGWDHLVFVFFMCLNEYQLLWVKEIFFYDYFWEYFLYLWRRFLLPLFLFFLDLVFSQCPRFPGCFVADIFRFNIFFDQGIHVFYQAFNVWGTLFISILLARLASEVPVPKFLISRCPSVWFLFMNYISTFSLGCYVYPLLLLAHLLRPLYGPLSCTRKPFSSASAML